MDPFELPDDITALNDEELSALLSGAVAAFDARSTSSSVTPNDLAELRSLAAGVDSIRTEQAARVEAATQAAAEIDALAAQVRGNEPAGTPAEPAEEPTAAAEPAPAPTPAPAPAAPAATASLVTRPALNLSGVRRRQPSVLPEPPAPTTSITAAVDVPGYTPGQPLEFGAITAGIISRANALKTAGGGVGQVISYRHPYPQDMIVTDSSSAPEGTTVAMHAANQRRLPHGDLVASGGWCAPSETVYDITDIACPDMLWDAPEIQLARGGLRYFKTPSLDVAALTWVHTEADDIAGNEKPCFKIPCPDPVEARCEAVGVCLESGILTQRHFPELTSWYVRNAMVAHEIRLRSVLFAAAVATATPVVLTATFGALAPVFAAVALQAADMIERHSLCESISLEVVFPWWSRNLFLADLARRNGVGLDQVSTAMVQDLFTPLGVRIQWARGLAPAVPTDIGGLVPAADWPAAVNFLIYPSGQLQIGRGEEVNLGVIHDSSKFVTNDYTALFSEECVTLVDRSVDTRIVTVPVCPSGATGAQTVMTCPAA
ncbi:major capsid protein [Streptomyces sp. H27-H5]|uniref:major capsid protein n=1 Tax=Streptomyces sp. H27-H5 TaxID=2996460 RepID=UPI00226D885B|nr:major capsid protein [Streptomyces sp. H27-H5]MCY0957734.1 major capsid protein [Streptomyces sp. H27-H5]